MQREHRAQRVASFKFGPSRILGDNLFKRGVKDLLGTIGWYYHHAVDISENPVARRYGYAGDGHGDVLRHHLRAVFSVQWADAAVKHRKTHRADAGDVAHQTVHHATGGLTRASGGGQEFAP